MEPIDVYEGILGFHNCPEDSWAFAPDEPTA